MRNLFKNRFMFIMIISVVTLVLLVVGAVTLYEDPSLNFNSDGYIISTTTKKNSKYYFSANTKYKRNVDDNVTFKDKDSKDVVVDPASFVHYLDGSVGYLKRGALVNLNEINASLINYYNVNEKSLISYKDGKYSFSINGEDVKVNAFIGRISDDKYLIAGNDLYLQVPNKNDKIKGDYFEVLFIEGGIVKVDNHDASYQVTAQGSYIYIGDNVVINLGNDKIYYSGEAKMLLSQITINGDENIDLDEIKNNASGGGTGEGEGDGTGEGEGDGTGEGEGDGTGEGEGDGTGEGEGGGTGEGEGDGTGEGEGGGTGEGGGIGEGGDGTGEGEGDGTGEGGSGGAGGSGTGEGSVVTDDSARVEIIAAEISSTVIDLSLQLNNAGAIGGTLRASLTNIGNGERVYEQDIPAVNGTFKVRKESLSPDTEYALSIYEIGKNSEKRYFQKTFRTKELGVTLEKNYTTPNSLAYGVVFDSNTDATKVRVTIYDSNGSNEDISPNSFVVSKSDLVSIIEFPGLKSNSSYSVSVESVWIDNAAYSDVYNINRIDNTLKETPVLSGLEVTANSEEVKFNIKLNNVKDPDKAILSYTYNFYLADEITLDNPNPDPIYTVVKNDSDALDINLNDVAELKAGVDYRCKIIAQYDDNEMIREVSTDYSKNFLVKSKPNVSFERLSVNVSEIIGFINLVDANCTVPVAGRPCANSGNDFVLRYYKMGEEETSDNDTKITFDGTSLKSNRITLSGLSSATTYAFKVFGNYYDDDGVLHKNIQLGDTFYEKTDDSETLKFKWLGDNLSGYNKNGEPNPANVITFDSVLQSPQDEQHKVSPEEISSITLNLYNGSYTKPENLIGNYVMKEQGEIADFFSNYNITNSLFTNDKIGKLDSLQKMIKVTNNSVGTLNGSYTVEVAKVLYPDGRTQYKVEDPIYTFKLTPEYYLDSRIESNPQYNYINVTKIRKEDLTEEEYFELSKKISNLDELNDDTYVGITIENSLSDAFVDSAFDYENVNVVFQVKNLVTNKYVIKDDDYLIDMDNKYQPSSVTIYLDPMSMESKGGFTRGYNYEVSYKLQFETEDGRDPEYINDKLVSKLDYKNEALDNSLYRQSPIYTMYISNSTANSITYRYKISDIDMALKDKKLYYKIGDDETTSLKEDFIVDNEFHDITIPINKRGEYSVCFNEKRSNGKNFCKFLSKDAFVFESEYNYDNSNSFNLLNEYDNTLKISLKNNDITNRAAAYKVSIKTSDSSMKTYVRYFLASQLFSEDIDTGVKDEDGNPILESIRYIAIDYASIADYMKHDLVVSVDCYYDSGLVGINQKFANGLVLENKVKGKYLNIYNSGSNDATIDSVESSLNGIYMVRGGYEVDATSIHIYNHLQDSNPNLPDSNSKKYNPFVGATYYSSSNVDSTIGKQYELTFTSEGVNFGNHGVFNAKVLKIANLKSSNNNYRFDSITPRVSLDTKGSTINSLSLKVNCSGVYGQFIKDSQPHNKFYLEVYSDSELTNKLDVLESDITISGSKVTADVVYLENLIPDTTYYVLIYAYMDGRYTRLYDSADKKTYVIKTYEAKTLNASGVLKRIDFSVNPVSYKYDNNNKIAYPSNKELKWKLKFNNTKNFKVIFELYDQNDKAINFDGTDAVNCDRTLSGSSSNGYVKGCYIQVDRKNIDVDISSSDKIDDVEKTYSFGGDNFVFGDGYYKLIVYAIPYTNGSYDYDNQLVLYQNDSLGNTDLTTVNGMMYKMTIPTLKEATFELKNYKSECVGNSCSMSFVPSIVDSGKVIKGGKYTISLKYENEVIETLNMDANTIGNNLITFDSLSSATMYELEFSYEANVNNNGYTEEQKNYMTHILNEVYTAVYDDIVLGNVEASAPSNQRIVLSYSGSYNLSNKIVQIVYTVRPLKESGSVSGTINLVNGNGHFEVQADKVLKLTLDLAQANFTLKSGHNYNIYMDYYYKDTDGELVLLGGKSFTTRLSF